jgi:surface antigen
MKRQVSGEKIADLLASTALVACLLTIGFGAGKANAEDGKGRVSLMATLKSAPAFQPMAWEVIRQGSVVAKTKRHSITLQLIPAKDYTATVTCPNGDKRSREFTVGVNKTTPVVITCD